MAPLRRLALVLPAVLGSLALLLAGGATARPGAASGDDLVEVVVTLPQPPLAAARERDRALAAGARRSAVSISARPRASRISAPSRRLSARSRLASSAPSLQRRRGGTTASSPTAWLSSSRAPSSPD